MHNMKADDGAYSLNHQQYLSDSVKRGCKKSARFDIPGETSSGETSNNGSVKPNDEHVDSELSEIDELSLNGSSEGTSTSMKIRQVSEELERLESWREREQKQHDQSESGETGPEFTFTSKAFGWEEVEKEFKKLTANTDGWLPRERFGECLGMNVLSKVFAEELFDALVRRKDITEKTHVTPNSIDRKGLDEFWGKITDKNFGSRLQIFFDMVDKDADGKLSKEEVREIISLSASANKLVNIKNKADEYAALIMEELDPSKSGYIMIEDLKSLLSRATAHPKRGNKTKELSQKLSRDLKTIKNHVVSKTYDDTKFFVIDYRQRLWMLTLWVGIMAGLFAYKYVQYKNKAVYEVMGVCVCLAKGAAETLKFNMALILLPVCRNTITWLRNKTRLGSVVPFDDNIKFHQIIAIGIAIGVGIHGMAHLSCDFPRLLHTDEEKYKLMEPFFGKDQPPNYWWFLKGVEGITGIVMVVLMAIAFTLASPWFKGHIVRKIKRNQNEEKGSLEKLLDKLTGFNAFWYSHHLFVIVYALLIVHGIKLYLTHDWYKKTTWMYVAVPIILYACERLIRAFRSSIKDVQIKKVVVYPDDVLALHVFKPQGFKYKSGQYMFVNCAAVSPFEWHPFSITSSPNDDYLSVHIRNLGDWTEKIQEVFSKVCQSPKTGRSGVLRADFIRGENNNPIVPKLLIDGPYGAPAQDYKKYDVVLLIGLGIGATPMISIMKDIANNIKAKEEKANAIENGFGTACDSGSDNKKSPGPSIANDFKTRKAYFYWVAPTQGSFDWFKGVINEVTDVDKNGVIEIHNYCTSVYQEGAAQSALISMLQSINYAKHGIDIVAGTRVKSHFAKPDWRKVFKNIAVKHPSSQVGVFFCGRPQAVKELKKHTADFSHRTSTTFVFHKENF